MTEKTKMYTFVPTVIQEAKAELPVRKAVDADSLLGEIASLHRQLRKVQDRLGKVRASNRELKKTLIRRDEQVKSVCEEWRKSKEALTKSKSGILDRFFNWIFGVGNWKY